MTTEKFNVEIDGIKLNCQTENVRYGSRPTSLFAGMSIDSERGYAILMGDASNVMRFGMYVKDRGGGVLIGLLRRDGDGEHFAACVLGEWPTARLNDVIRQFSIAVTGGPAVWARLYMDTIRADPDRLEVGGPDEDSMRFFAKLYDHQCRLSAQ